MLIYIPSILSSCFCRITAKHATKFHIVLLLCFCIVPRSWSQYGDDFRIDHLIIQTQDKPILFQIEIAETSTQRARGLMWRQSLALDKGMLFDFNTDKHVMMWMKNTYISLDLIFITKNGLILNIIRNTSPHSTQPLVSAGPVRAVLELVGGATKKYGIQSGDNVIHSIFKP